jgi:hypothetical protein
VGAAPGAVQLHLPGLRGRGHYRRVAVRCL